MNIIPRRRGDSQSACWFLLTEAHPSLRYTIEGDFVCDWGEVSTIEGDFVCDWGEVSTRKGSGLYERNPILNLYKKKSDADFGVHTAPETKNTFITRLGFALGHG